MGDTERISDAYAEVADGEYARAVERGDVKRAMDMLGEKAALRGYSTRLWRVSSRPLASFSDGVFFTTDPIYYGGSDTGYSADDAREYLLRRGIRVFDPIADADRAVVNTWSHITMKMSDINRWGIEDETDWVETEGLGNTSTVGLAIAGHRMGYDATVIRDVPNDGGWGSYFSEYAVYDGNNVKAVDITYDDEGTLIPLSKRYDVTSSDVRY